MTTMTDIDPTTALAERLRMDALDMRRRDPQAAAAMLRDIARTLGEDTTTPRAGFSAASPYEMCQRYAAGLIDRDELVDQLARWPFDPLPQMEPWNEVPVAPPNTFLEVLSAFHAGLITSEEYGQIQAAVEQASA